ncbi:MAG: hypothetical protein ACRDLB_13780, partial [Actinomycetota bacterium]
MTQENRQAEDESLDRDDQAADDSAGSEDALDEFETVPVETGAADAEGIAPEAERVGEEVQQSETDINYDEQEAPAEVVEAAMQADVEPALAESLEPHAEDTAEVEGTAEPSDTDAVSLPPDPAEGAVPEETLTLEDAEEPDVGSDEPLPEETQPDVQAAETEDATAADSAEDDSTAAVAAAEAEQAPAPAAAEAETDEEIDDYEERVVPPTERPGSWYVVHTYAGYENKVKTNL